MNLYEARNAMGEALAGTEAHNLWDGMRDDDRNEFAMPLAYGEKTLSECVEEFIDFAVAE